jgi:hypothetical protein
MGKTIGISLVTLLCILHYSPATAGFDGSAPLLCAVVEAFECSPEQDCNEGNLEAMNIPQFVRIDFKNQKISTPEGTGEKREAEIKNFVQDNGMLLMQGVQNGRSWSIAVAEDTGKLTATSSGAMGGFVIFGACILD